MEGASASLGNNMLLNKKVYGYALIQKTNTGIINKNERFVNNSKSLLNNLYANRVTGVSNKANIVVQSLKIKNN